MICHNNKTICVAPESVQDHLNHGDYLGNCAASAVWEENESLKLSSRDVNVYPNPVTEVLNIQLNKDGAGSVVKLYNQSGVLVRTLLMNGTSGVIPVRGLAAGLYYLHINTREVITIRKIVKL